MKIIFKILKLLLHHYWLKIRKTGPEKIPEGMYCYKSLEGDNIRICPYYYSFKDGDTGCAYCGFIGFDLGHTDLCKICDENTECKTECKEWCGMNYCDDNGCVNRKRNLVNKNPKKLIEDVEVLYHAYGHTNKGDGIVVQVIAKNGKEALDKARIEHPDCKFSHTNI